jgi:rhodanese-related sulfurtransferase
MKHLLRAVVMGVFAVLVGLVHARISGRPIGVTSPSWSATRPSDYGPLGYPYITLSYGSRLHASRAADFVDAGTAEGHERRKIPGAVPISLDEFSNGGFPARLETMSRDRTIVVYCASGCSSAEYVAQRIREFGFENTLILVDGMAAWVSAGLPFEAVDR